MLFLTQPYLLTLDPAHEMNIIWIQNTKTAGSVYFGATETPGNCVEAECYEITGLRAPLPDGSYGKTPEEHPPVSVWQYVARIDGLAPGQTVYYRCEGGDESTKVYFFRTAPEKGGSFRFAQLSDHQGLPDCDESVYQIGLTHPDFMLYAGDASYVSWQLDQWFDTGDPRRDEKTARKAFFPCMQQENGARLMQYAPLFFCPGNHEVDDMRCFSDKAYSAIDENWNWSIFMQIFRPLYPDPDTTLTGKRWYSADYGDLHISSLSVNHFSFWDATQYPGWRMFDSIAPDSAQIRWLREDLANADTKFKWVIQHFHILNKAEDVQYNLCDPVFDENNIASYPDDEGGKLMELFAENRVNAVSYGHSHVYERYYYKGTHYIEAAYLSICFRRGGEPLHPSGLLPVVEDISKRSFLIVERRDGGLFARGFYVEDASVPFDEYRIANEDGNPVEP